MTAAIALAVVLVIAVAGMSLAMQTQRPMQSGPRMARPPRPTPSRATPRRASGRRAGSAAPPTPPDPDPEPKTPLPKGPELLRTGTPATAKVVSVVDERTLGPVTRSRVTLQIEPVGASGFEVTTRVAFPTPAARAKVKVGGTVPVRFDKDDHNRVVLDLPDD
jgi:hypothetical protein